MILVLLCLALAQLPARDSRAAAATGTASISGRVVDAESGEPIADAVVHIGMLTMGARTTAIETDERGGFTLAGLAAGDYMLLIRPPELHVTHLPAVLNNDVTAMMTPRRKPSLTLKDGEQRTDVVVRLERALAIEGQVVDEYGEPMVDMQISTEVLEGAPFGLFGGQSSNTTDDRGTFRAFGLTPGTYRVCASPSGSPMPMPRATSGEVGQRRYVKTCYPSSPEGGGERVAVGPRGTPPLTIVMQRSVGYTISGRARSESGAPVRNVSLSRGSGTGDRTGPVDTQPDGRFVARGVTPGDYTIIARAGEERGALGEFRMNEQARVQVRVEASDVSGLDLVTTRGATLLGRIVPEGPLPSGTTLTVRPAISLGLMVVMDMPRPAAVRPDLTFELANVHDDLLLDVQGLPTGWVVASVRYRGSEIVETPTKMASTLDPSQLEIVVSPKSATVTARAVNAAGAPVPDAIVFMLSTTSDRAFQPRNVNMMQEPGDAPFELPAVRGGNYLLIAVPMLDMMRSMRGGEAIAALRKLGQPITLTPGEKRTIDVVVRTLAEVK